MTAGVTTMVVELIQNGSIPREDYDSIRQAMTGAGMPPEGTKYRLTRVVRPQYLVGMIGTLGQEPGQHSRKALYITNEEVARYGDRVKRFLRHAPGKGWYISVKDNMVEEVTI